MILKIFNCCISFYRCVWEHCLWS